MRVYIPGSWKTGEICLEKREAQYLNVGGTLGTCELGDYSQAFFLACKGRADHFSGGYFYFLLVTTSTSHLFISNKATKMETGSPPKAGTPVPSLLSSYGISKILRFTQCIVRARSSWFKKKLLLICVTSCESPVQRRRERLGFH